MLCEALVRYYEDGRRRVHPAHFDADALVTAVFEVSPPDGFEGGFYVQPGAHVSSRLPVRLEAGEVIAHSFDLQHGVEVPPISPHLSPYLPISPHLSPNSRHSASCPLWLLQSPPPPCWVAEP